MTPPNTTGAQALSDEERALLAYVLQEEKQNRLTPRVIDIAYSAFMLAKQPNKEDGGSSDWFNDARPAVQKMIEKLHNDFAALAGREQAGAVAERMKTVSDALVQLDGLYADLCDSAPERPDWLRVALRVAHGAQHGVAVNLAAPGAAIAAREQEAKELLAIADFLGGAKDRLNRPDASANDQMRAARAAIQSAALRHGVAGGHHTYLDQCAAVLRALAGDR